MRLDRGERHRKAVPNRGPVQPRGEHGRKVFPPRNSLKKRFFNEFTTQFDHTGDSEASLARNAFWKGLSGIRFDRSKRHRKAVPNRGPVQPRGVHGRELSSHKILSNSVSVDEIYYPI